MMVDTNVVIDLVAPGSRWFDWAAQTVHGAKPRDGVTASVIVVAELASAAGSVEEIAEMLGGFKIAIAELEPSAAFRAGVAHSAYRLAGGTREKLLGDFLIGAHAAARNVPLATRDPKPYRRYFPDLALITPELDHG